MEFWEFPMSETRYGALGQNNMKVYAEFGGCSLKFLCEKK